MNKNPVKRTLYFAYLLSIAVLSSVATACPLYSSTGSFLGDQYTTWGYTGCGGYGGCCSIYCNNYPCEISTLEGCTADQETCQGAAVCGLGWCA